MALLQQLRQNLLDLPYEEGLITFTEYYFRRERELTEIQITPKATKRKTSVEGGTKLTKGKTVSVSSDQLALLKKLGLI
jgi:hypothetical protein